MISVQDIRSLTDFQRNTKAHLKRLKATGRPAVLTANGKAELIVQDAVAFEDMLDAMKAGKGEPARVVLDRIRAKYKISRSPR